jgi:hypothetical protein
MRHQVLASLRRFAERRQAFLDQLVIALGAHPRHSATLFALRLLRDLQELDLELGLVGHEIVDANDHAPVLLDLPLLPRRRLVDFALEPARLQSTHDAPDLGDLFEQHLGFALELGCKRLDVIGAA